MRLLTCSFVSSEEFLSHYSAAVGGGALFYRTRAALGQGEAVLLEVSFPGLPNRALMRGTVLERRQRKGSWVRLEQADTSTLAFLLHFARGHSGDGRRRERAFDRFPARVPVEARASDQRVVIGSTADLGAGGAFVTAGELPAVGTQVELVLGPTGERRDTYRVTGEVAWVSAGHDRGFGVRFHPRSSADGRRLRVMLRRASECGRASFAGRAG